MLSRVPPYKNETNIRLSVLRWQQDPFFSFLWGVGLPKIKHLAAGHCPDLTILKLKNLATKQETTMGSYAEVDLEGYLEHLKVVGELFVVVVDAADVGWAKDVCPGLKFYQNNEIRLKDEVR